MELKSCVAKFWPLGKCDCHRVSTDCSETSHGNESPAGWFTLELSQVTVNLLLVKLSATKISLDHMTMSIRLGCFLESTKSHPEHKH